MWVIIVTFWFIAISILSTITHFTLIADSAFIFTVSIKKFDTFQIVVTNQVILAFSDRSSSYTGAIFFNLCSACARFTKISDITLLAN